MRNTRHIRRSKNKIAGDLTLDPLRENRASQVNLRQEVKAKDALKLRLRGRRERVKPATAGMPEHGIHVRKTVEGFVDDPAQAR